MQTNPGLTWNTRSQGNNRLPCRSEEHAQGEVCVVWACNWFDRLFSRLVHSMIVSLYAAWAPCILLHLQTADMASLLKLSSLLPSPTSTSNATSSSKPSYMDGSASSATPIAHYLWIEQPENIPTCIALAPNRREKVIRRAPDRCSCRLWKGWGLQCRFDDLQAVYFPSEVLDYCSCCAWCLPNQCPAMLSVKRTTTGSLGPKPPRQEQSAHLRFRLLYRLPRNSTLSPKMNGLESRDLVVATCSMLHLACFSIVYLGKSCICAHMESLLR